ncbi:hypothetical protein BYT27DRAFT_7183188, partial [Phlegmacium glaucopus]
MVESSPLLDDSNRNLDDNFEAQTNVPVGSYFKRLIQSLIIITLILSALTLLLLIANYVILKRVAPIPSPDYRSQRIEYSSKELAKFVLVSLVFSTINVLVDLPILLNLIVDIVLAACLIPRVFLLLDTLPDSYWCPIPNGYPYPYPYPHQKCKDWKSVVTILMGIAASFGAIVGYVENQKLTNGPIVLFMRPCWFFEASRFREPNLGRSQRGESPWRL